MSTKRMVGSVDSLFGMLRRSGTPPRSVEEIDEMIARVVMADDERIRRGEKAGRRSHSILELRGLGKELWEGIDPVEYVRAERDSWGD